MTRWLTTKFFSHANKDKSVEKKRSTIEVSANHNIKEVVYITLLLFSIGFELSNN